MMAMCSNKKNKKTCSQQQMKQIVLFIGAPGSGKSTLGTYLAKKHCKTCRFFSAGEWIRENDLLSTRTDEELRTAADLRLREILDEDDERLVLLEFVKDLDNAFMMLDIIRNSPSRLVQVIWINDETEHLIEKMAARLKDSPSHRTRDRWARLPKWHANVGRIVEVFSSLSVLCLLTRRRARQSMFIEDYGRSCDPVATMLPKTLRLIPLSWVVSPQLMVDAHRSEQIVDQATRCMAGLRHLQFLMPGASVRTQEDMQWVSHPGRYSVSHKCDGTRYLLLVMSDGQVFFKNRVDFVYSYPIETNLPSQTILDGELIWEAERGVFLVFDALVVRGERLWGWPFERRIQRLSCILQTDEHLAARSFSRGLHRQRAPSANAMIQVVLKRHYDTLKCMATPAFPSDGLIFTAKAMPYVLPTLTRKWQPVGKRAVDLRGDYDLIYECVHDGDEWRPETIRWDKTRESDCMEQIHSACRDMSILEGPAWKQLVSMPLINACSTPPDEPLFRPILSRAECMCAVEAGKVERTVDVNTGLDIFNRRKNGTEIPCRGILFDEDRPVAAAFESFQVAIDQKPSSCWASLKLDGTLIIAFIYGNRLRTSTRRRMDSEQAIWANKWLATNANLDEFKEGWTYAFEAVYEDNTVIVPYPFDGLVFLDAWSPDGMSRKPTERLEQATHLGVMCAPFIHCDVQDAQQLLSPVESVPSYEGWILQCAGKRWKLVQEAYKQASKRASTELHPLWVWNRVRMGEQPNAIIAHLPAHLKRERSKMLKAMEKAFQEEFQHMFLHLEVDFDADATFDLLCDTTKYTPRYGSSTTVKHWVKWFAFRISSDSWIPSCLADEENICLTETTNDKHTFKDIALKSILKPISMYYHPFADYRKLRLELLDRIRPEDNGTLRYYEPSTNLMQTFHKGWSAPPELFADLSTITLKLGDTGTLDLILSHAPLRAILVCKTWYRIITQDAENYARKKLETESTDSSAFFYDSGDSNTGQPNHHFDLDGYGSF